MLSAFPPPAPSSPPSFLQDLLRVGWCLGSVLSRSEALRPGYDSGWHNRSLKLSIQGTIGISKQETKLTTIQQSHPAIPSISHLSPAKSLAPLPIPASAMPSSKGSSNAKSIASISSAAARKLKGLAKTATRAVFCAAANLVNQTLQMTTMPTMTSCTIESTNRLRSGVYQFFKSPVLREDDDGRKYQFFECAAPKGCKHKAKGRRSILDGQPYEACNKVLGERCCEGADEGCRSAGKDGSIFGAFARASEHPVAPSDRTLTEAELRAHIVRWVAESHRPLTIVEDREFMQILGAGRPEYRIPRRRTVGRDLHAAYERCREYVVTLLRSHTGEVLAREFDEMLARFDIQHKILAWTGDNATSNDTQNTALSDNPKQLFRFR
ncbi:hypothetical protein B0H14DRAFT_2556810 [Mycena olivaceomarginata]|nr:hypothetical protein B0H14DRAFT_2556810 [Mycena olivaceomarginata]